ncbi:helix-turn-helix domain-containing protein [Pseudomonadota bacterium]
MLAKVWHAKMGYHSNIVQATIRRLRKKIDEGFSFPLIRNIHGIGYSVVLP